MPGVAGWLVRAFCAMFYVATPTDLALGEEDPQPQILLNYGIPMFFILIAIERCCMLVRGNPNRAKDETGGNKPLPKYRVNDMVISTLLGTFQVKDAFSLC